MKRLAVIAAISFAVIGCASTDTEPGTESPGEPTTGTAQLPATAVAQIEALIAEKEARTPAQRKVASQLLYAKSGRFDSSMKTGGGKVTSLLQRDDGDRVLIDVKGAGSADLTAKIQSLGGTVVGTSAAHASARAWLRLDQVEALAGDASVRNIRPALLATTRRAVPPYAPAKYGQSRAERVAAVQRAVKEARTLPTSRLSPTLPIGAIGNAGAAESEGDAAHGAVRARKFFNVDGTGVKIGVLSDSDDFKEDAITTGDLPTDTVTVPGQDGRPGSGEGTAMMEIVHDVAPGAKLFFATAFNSAESFADNIRTLRFVYHCDIIIDDIIYFVESPYQDDIIAQAVNDVNADGAMYFSSAGNEGNFDDGTTGVWEGDFKNGGTLATLPSGYTVHDFGDKVISNRIEVSGGPLTLAWSDPGTMDDPESSNDYDLFVLDEDLRNVAVASTDVQDGTGLPSEFLGFNIPSDFRVVVARHPGARNRAIRVVLFNGELGLSTPGAVYGHNSAAGAFAVAAVDAAEAGGAEFVAGPTTPVETYSSDGYRRIFYKPDGSPIGGGVTFASGGGDLRKKPEIAGADGVSTTLPPFSGLNPFFGTSAAAPHVGAIAGLLKSAAPNASASRIRKALLDGALDIEAARYDRDSGAGIASAMNSLRDVGAKPAVFIELGTVNSTAIGSDVLLPGGSGQIDVQLVNNGGLIAKNVTAKLLTGSPFLTVTRGTAVYPDIPAGGSASSTAPFLFTIDPAAKCGDKLSFTLVVSFTGRGTSPVAFGLQVQTGRQGAATTFKYTGPDVAIPDGDAAGVDVGLDVSFSGAAAKVVFRIDGDTCTSDAGATTVGVDHTWVGDLIFTLTSPSGTALTVINQAGGAGNSGNNFCQTVLDDAAASSIQGVVVTDAPFTGTFTPANPESAFSGESADGTWTLNVSDNAFLDTGTIHAFSLDISGFTCDP